MGFRSGGTSEEMIALCPTLYLPVVRLLVSMEAECEGSMFDLRKERDNLVR
jgi:hypothetical protein